MREDPPADLGVTDDTVRGVVRERWLPAVEEVRHLSVGFGAWHWQALAHGRPALFVTLDPPGVHHSRDSLEAAYAGAAELAGRGLEFVLSSLPGPDGRFTTDLRGGALSATPWRDGTSGDGSFTSVEAAATVEVLARLHAEPPPTGIPGWHPPVGPELPEELAARTLGTWDAGPHGETARRALADHLDDVARWTAAYLRAASASDPATWVTTHGEPHTRNQLATPDGVLLVDWESLQLAPPERDLRWLPGRGDPALVTMFDLEWRLDEIAQYADRFEAAHPGNASDDVALEGLLAELRRAE